MQILPGLPILPGIDLHSLMGDRGKGGPVEKSSDGVVEYWSSHLDGVSSEAVLPFSHTAVDHPDTVVEVRRILGLP